MRTALASDDEGEEPSGSISGYDANGDRWTVTLTGKVNIVVEPLDLSSIDEMRERIRGEVEKAMGERNKRLVSMTRRAPWVYFSASLGGPWFKHSCGLAFLWSHIEDHSQECEQPAGWGVPEASGLSGQQVRDAARRRMASLGKETPEAFVPLPQRGWRGWPHRRRALRIFKQVQRRLGSVNEDPLAALDRAIETNEATLRRLRLLRESIRDRKA